MGYTKSQPILNNVTLTWIYLNLSQAFIKNIKLNMKKEIKNKSQEFESQKYKGKIVIKSGKTIKSFLLKYVKNISFFTIPWENAPS